MDIRGQGADTGGNQTSPTIDDIFNYDAGLDEILRETEVSQHKDTSDPSRRNTPADSNGANLGLDEEIKVAPKRRPVAKLDEAKLLSPAGIPKLRKNAKTKLKFKGKNHEYSDAMRLLNFYQLWLDDLYPRAKFVDGLAMIEKLGHSKRIQIMRKEWIDECKPKLCAADRDEEESINTKIQLSAANATKATYNEAEQGKIDSELFPGTTTNTIQHGSRIPPSQYSHHDVDDSTENQMPSIFGGGGGRGTTAGHTFANNVSDDNRFVRNFEAHVTANTPARTVETTPEDDELDAILAEQEGGSPSHRETSATNTTKRKDSSWGPLSHDRAFDDLDAMDDYDF
ncbi:hypothetical protein AJ78_06138 [Emergomyces pasteurianus Ep9510]|uniref:Chromosome segregation in meiosis protein n=1 Tax=Emergomyces pasteurianus Ep9510 TaxID=1447872 RepID=A0A1J9QBW2_9EURO|nr:hypothetical protein AJ78_06138 [Emergomyces pasteurianus Ep9510]